MITSYACYFQGFKVKTQDVHSRVYDEGGDYRDGVNGAASYFTGYGVFHLFRDKATDCVIFGHATILVNDDLDCFETGTKIFNPNDLRQKSFDDPKILRLLAKFEVDPSECEWVSMMAITSFRC